MSKRGFIEETKISKKKTKILKEEKLNEIGIENKTEKKPKTDVSKWIELQFTLPSNFNQNRILFAGLFPPARSHAALQHANNTSVRIINTLGHTHFDWIDILCRMPPDYSSESDQHELDKFLQETDLRNDWKNRILCRVYELNQRSFTPVVFICGAICKKQWNQLTFDHSEKIDNDGFLKIFRIEHMLNNQKIGFYVLYGRHPSAHLQAHGKPEEVKQFKKEMIVLNLLWKNQDIKNVCSHFDLQDQLHAKHLTLFLKSRFNMIELPSFLNHLNRMPFHSDLFRERMQQISCEDHLKSVSLLNRILTEEFWQIYSHGFQHCNRQQLEHLFSNDAFCVHILDIGFLNRFDNVRIFVNDLNFLLMLYNTNSFCVRINQNDFWEQFQILYKSNLGDINVVKLYTTEAFCTHVLTSGFLEKFQHLRKDLNLESTMKLFSTESFCSHILVPGFVELFQHFYKNCDRDYTLKLFSTESFCAHIQSPGFAEIFEAFYRTFNPIRTLRLFSTESFCSHVLKPGFIEIFKDFYSRFKKDDSAMKLFCTESFCAHVLSPGFVEIFNQFSKNRVEFEAMMKPNSIGGFDIEATITLFKTEGFAKRVLDSKFQEIMKRYIVDYGVPQMISTFSTPGFCTNVLEDGFEQTVHSLLTFKIEIKYILKFLKVSSFCTNLLNRFFLNRFGVFAEAYPFEFTYHIFRNSSFCSRIKKDEFVAAILKLNGIFCARNNEPNTQILSKLNFNTLSLLRGSKLCMLLLDDSPKQRSKEDIVNVSKIDIFTAILKAIEAFDVHLTIRISCQDDVCEHLNNSYLLFYLKLWKHERNRTLLTCFLRSKSFRAKLLNEGEVFLKFFNDILQRYQIQPIALLENNYLMENLSFDFIENIISFYSRLGFRIDDIYILLSGEKCTKFIQTNYENKNEFEYGLLSVLECLNTLPLEKDVTFLLAHFLTSNNFAELCKQDIVGYCSRIWNYVESLFVDWSNIQAGFQKLISCDSFHVAYKQQKEDYLVVLASLFVNQQEKDLYLISLFSNAPFLVRCKYPEFIAFFKKSFAAFGSLCIECFASATFVCYVEPQDFCKNALFDEEFHKWEQFQNPSEWNNYLSNVPNETESWWETLFA